MMNRINRKEVKKAIETVSPDGRFSKLELLEIAYEYFTGACKHDDEEKAMETVSPDGRFSSLTNLGLAYDDFAAGGEHGKDDDNDE